MDFEGFEQNFSSTKNGRIFYLHRKSSGKPIIFLHGIGGSSITWNKLVPYLPKGLDIYLVDMLGHGRSDAPAIEYDVMVQVEMLEELMENLGIAEPIIFGHSYGGWAAIHYSLLKKTRGLIIEDSAGMGSQQAEIKEAGKTEEDRNAIITDSVKMGANEKVIRSAVGNFDSYPLTNDALTKVSSRTLLIWGDNDEFVPIKFGREMHDLIKGSDMLVIPNAGHVPHRTRPEAVASAISVFCGMPNSHV